MTSEEKMFKLQQQVQNTNADLQAMISDMGKWEREMKEKERLDADRAAYEEGERQADVPPVRGSSSINITKERKEKKKKEKDEKKKKEVKQDVDSEPKKKLKGYDYDAWDKLDVDKMCEEVDAADKCCSSESGDDETNLWEKAKLESEQKKQKAMMEKDKGNDFLKKGKIDKAISCYANAMKDDPMNAIFPANRAQAYLKKDMFREAEEDCTLSLSLDPTYVKAFYRRGVARLEQAKAKMERENVDNKLRMARDDFLKVLDAEPQNKHVSAHLAFIKKCVDEYKGKREALAQESGAVEGSEDLMDGVVVIKPVEKPEHCRSKVPLHRVKIEEIGGGGDHISLVEEKNCIEQQQITKNDKRQQLAEATGGSTTFTASLATEKPKPPKLPLCPETAIQFQQDMKLLLPHLDLLYKYLCSIMPECLPSLFSSAFLDKDILQAIIQVFVEYGVANDLNIYPYLKYLSAVNRFDIVAMFIGEQDKEALSTIFWHCLNHESEGDVKSLAQKYGVKLERK